MLGLNWLFKFFRKVPTDPLDRLDQFRPEDRIVYHYWDGEKEVHVDPLPLYRKVAAAGPELDVLIKLSKSIHPDAGKGQAELAEKVRECFSVKPYEATGDKEVGLTEVEVLNLLDHFLIFCGLVKKNSSPTATSAGEASPGTPPSSDGSQPTSSTSGSGSTESDPSTEPPTP